VHKHASVFCSLSLFPKTVNICGIAAGLLTCLSIDAFPVAQWLFVDPFWRLTAAGTVPDFHRIPFSSRKSGNRNTDANINRIEGTLFNLGNFMFFRFTCNSPDDLIYFAHPFTHSEHEKYFFARNHRIISVAKRFGTIQTHREGGEEGR
jgi:hypothetical protein